MTGSRDRIVWFITDPDNELCAQALLFLIMRLFFESADPAADLPFAGPLTAESEPEETLIVRDATLVRGPTEWADISVYRGTCDLDHSGKPKSVVCKVGFDDDQRFLPKEWAVYQNLISLQGKYIPIAYRLVAGSTEIGDATCLMLEDCGEPLSNFFHKYPLELKYVLLLYQLLIRILIL